MNIEDIDITEQEILEDERIDAYLRGEMSEEDGHEFLAELKAKPELRAKALAVARMIKAMQKVGAERDKATIETLRSMDKAEVEKMAEEIVRPREIPKMAAITAEPDYSGMPVSASGKLRMWHIISIAAVFLCLFIFGGIKYVDYRNTQQLADNYAVYITNMHEKTYIMGDSDVETRKELATLFDKVKNNQMDDTTISRLEKLWKLSQSKTYNDYTVYAPEIGYALAIAYLREGDKEKAKEVLNKIENKADGELKNEIQQLIKTSWLK